MTTFITFLLKKKKNWCKLLKTGKKCNEKKTIYGLTEKVPPDHTSTGEDGQNGQKYANAATSVHVTWMKKGHQLKLGFLFVQNVLKGFDYALKSFSCSRYTGQKKKKHSEEESEEWFENHKDNCKINHKGSSGNMKSEKYAPIRNMFILYAKQFDLQDFCSGISVVSER